MERLVERLVPGGSTEIGVAAVDDFLGGRWFSCDNSLANGTRGGTRKDV